jgi:hypothetical protein
MDKSFIELGATFFVAISLIELLKYSIGLLAKKKDNGIESKGSNTLLEKIAENDLVHINNAMETQNKILCQHTIQHEAQTIILTRIATILEMANNKK